MIDEAREDNKENDAQYMKPGIASRCKTFFSPIKAITNADQIIRTYMYPHSRTQSMARRSGASHRTESL